MLNEKQIEKKLYDQVDMFMHYIRRKDYLEAALCVDDAKRIALFIELEEDKMVELFGDRKSEQQIEGLFSEEWYMKACEWCIFKGGYAESRHTYQNVQKMR